MNPPKLVRDDIDRVICESGQVPHVRIAGFAEHKQRLRDKMVEELGEFLDSGDPGDPWELVDYLEAGYAYGSIFLGLEPEELEKLRLAKRKERGGFTRGLVWLGNSPATPD